MAIQSRRAIRGGETVGGKFFKGGQFVAKDALAIQAGLDRPSVAAGKKKLDKAVDKAAFKSFANAAASIRKAARESILRRKGPSRPGEPIHTRSSTKRRKASGKVSGLAKRTDAILFDANRRGAVIGFTAHAMGQSMEVHEFGKSRGGVKFPERPTMAPALERNLARFHSEWRGAI